MPHNDHTNSIPLAFPVHEIFVNVDPKAYINVAAVIDAIERSIDDDCNECFTPEELQQRREDLIDEFLNYG